MPSGECVLLSLTRRHLKLDMTRNFCPYRLFRVDGIIFAFGSRLALFLAFRRTVHYGLPWSWLGRSDSDMTRNFYVR